MKTMRTMRMLIVTAVFAMVLSFSPQLTIADTPVPDHSDATCAISITVNSIVEWETGAFAAINLAAITQQSSKPTGNQTLTLWSNCNVTLTADNTDASRLTHTVGTTDYLVTKYMLSFGDGDGTTHSGPTPANVTSSGSDAYVANTAFLTTALPLDHVDGDGAIEVTLYVEASNDDTLAHKDVADVGVYNATQTLTATFVDDNP